MEVKAVIDLVANVGIFICSIFFLQTVFPCRAFVRRFPRINSYLFRGCFSALAISAVLSIVDNAPVDFAEMIQNTVIAGIMGLLTYWYYYPKKRYTR